MTKGDGFGIQRKQIKKQTQVNKQLFSKIEVNSGRKCTDLRSMEVNILKVTIH